MQKSLYLRRTILLILFTVVLCAVLTAGLYSVVSRYVFADMKTNELIEISEFIGSEVNAYARGIKRAESVQGIVYASAQVFGTQILVFDYNADILFSAFDEGQTGPVANLVEALKNDIIDVLGGQALVRPQPRDYGNFVIIGTPVLVGNMIYGAVFLVMPMQEVTTALSGLLRTLLLSSLAGALLMFFPAYYFSKRLLGPLHEMKNVASAMSRGNFNVRAGKKYRGEFGELAVAFDNLADNLSSTISALSLERTRLRQVLDGLSEGIISVDADGMVTHTNPAVRRMFGNEAPDIPQDRESMVPDPRIWMDFDLAIGQNTSMSRDIPHGGQTIRVSVTPLIDDDGSAAGAVGLFRDITEAQRLEQTRRDYVANVSHEMRTPLTAMRALVEPLSDGMVSTENDRRRYYSMLLSEIKRLTRLINDMLELSRLQAGSVSMKKSDESLHELLGEVSAKYSGVAEDADIRYLTPFLDHPDERVRINRDRIEQILVILLDNAVKYTPAGGSISLDGKREGDRVVVSVADTGIGIAPEDLPHVFERFYKADKSRRPASGTGLGLSIAREILDALGEKITVESTPEQGSVFSFTLSLEDEEVMT